MPNEFSTDSEFLTVSEVAYLLSVSERSIRRLIADDELASYYIRGSVRISRFDIDRYLEQSRASKRRVGFGE